LPWHFGKQERCLFTNVTITNGTINLKRMSPDESIRDYTHERPQASRQLFSLTVSSNGLTDDYHIKVNLFKTTLMKPYSMAVSFVFSTRFGRVLWPTLLYLWLVSSPLTNKKKKKKTTMMLTIGRLALIKARLHR